MHTGEIPAEEKKNVFILNLANHDSKMKNELPPTTIAYLLMNGRDILQ